MMRSIGWFALGLSGLLVSLTGCGPGDTNPAAASPCDLLACGVSQKICVDDAKGPRCEPCPTGQYAGASGACENLQGTAIKHEFSEFTVQPGEEILGLCQSFTLNNPEEIWVNAVELEQNEWSHHSNWTFVPSDKFNGPDGVWKCGDRDYDQVTAALAGGVLYAQSTQATREVQKFPDGVALRIPPYSRVIGDVHLLNPSMTPATGSLKLNIYGIPKAEVAHKLVPFHLNYSGLAIPPHQKSRFVGECDLTGPYGASGATFDPKVYFILPHTHALAAGFFLEIFGGPRDGEKIIQLGPYDGEAHGRVYEKPIDMTGASGYRFGCEYHSDRDAVVKWGFGDQEMCELLGFAETTVAFESNITSAAEVGTDGDVRIFSAPCSILAFPWDHNKPGGPVP